MMEDSLHMEPLSSEAACNLFVTLMKWDGLTTIPESEIEAAKMLLEKLQGLALGIRQMAAIIKVQDRGVKYFLERYHSGRERQDGSLKLDDYEFDLDTVWKASFSDIEERRSSGSDAFDVLGIIAFLYPDEIPNDIFSGHREIRFKTQSFRRDVDHDWTCAFKELVEMALIDPIADHQAHSIHRLVQDAFLEFLDEPSRQGYFDCAAKVLHAAFPQQVEGRPLHLQWKDCERYLPHVKHLTNRFNDSQQSRTPLVAPPIFAELLKSCVWYLFEIGDRTTALTITTLALRTCPDPDSILYAHLSNTLFGIYFELNDLRNARPHAETALDIRKRLDTEEEYSNTLSNMGNLYSAEGRLADALRCFDASELIRQRLGDEGIIGLALTRMGIGRAQALKGDYTAAEQRFTSAKEVILRTFGPDGHFMADVHYAFGKLHRLKRDLPTARTYYTEGLRVLQAQGMPTHVFNTAFLYKLACISIAEGGLDEAKNMLAKALTLAEPSRDSSPGDMARILYKQAQLLRLLGVGSESPEVAEKEVVSAQLREMIERERLPVPSGEVVVVAEGEGAEGEEDAAYDRLVCAFLR